MTLNDETAARIARTVTTRNQVSWAGMHVALVRAGYAARDAEVEELRARVARAEDFVTAHYLDTQMGQKVLEILGEPQGRGRHDG